MGFFSKKESELSLTPDPTVIIENAYTGNAQEVNLDEYLVTSINEHLQRAAVIQAANPKPEQHRRFPRRATIFQTLRRLKPSIKNSERTTVSPAVDTSR
jgi:hypothetical protein